MIYRKNARVQFKKWLKPEKPSQLKQKQNNAMTIFCRKQKDSRSLSLSLYRWVWSVCVWMEILWSAFFVIKVNS